MSERAYHFVGKTLRDGSPIPADGEWLTVEGEPVLCKKGLHASLHPFDALQYAPGGTLCLVELGGTIVKGDDKVVAQKRKIIARFDATDMLWEQARQSALSVIHLWDAPAIVREYLETGDEPKRAAASAAAWDAASAAAWDAASAAARAAAGAAAGAAAWAAAGAAARAAAWAAAGAAARAAAWAAAGKRLQDAVDAKFKSMGVL